MKESAKVFTLAELAEILHAQEIHGDPKISIHGIATLQEAHAHEISFFHNARYLKQLQSTKADAVLIQAKDLPHCKTNAIIVPSPYVAFAKLTALFQTTAAPTGQIAQTARIADDVSLGRNVSIGEYCVIASGCVIEDDVQIDAHCVIGQGVRIGKATHLYAHVSLYDNVHIGQRCILHSGVVVGSDGFGFARDKNQWVKIHHLGGVRIGDDVEIGANTCVDRGVLLDTEIADGVKLDNQIQVAHNVKIGARTVIAGCTGIAGSTTIGEDCVIGGGVCLAGHLTIAKGVQIGGMAMVTKSLTEPGVYASGLPIQEIRTWKKEVAQLRRLDKLIERIELLEQQVHTCDEEVTLKSRTRTQEEDNV